MAGIEMKAPSADGQKIEAKDKDARTVGLKPGAEETPSAVQAYFKKFGGLGVAGPPRPIPTQHLYSFFGAFLGFAALGLLDRMAKMWVSSSLSALTPPFGAMCVLVFGACKAPLAQPRNVILGNTLGGTVGYLVWTAMHAVCAALGKDDAEMLWLTAALAVSLTIVAQERTGSVHPPGGATALVFVAVPPVRAMGIYYPIFPSFICPCVLVGLGVLTNNLSRNRAYPQTSWRSAGRPAVEDPAKRAAPSTWFSKYVQKLGGMGVPPPPKVPLSQSFWSFLGSFVGIATLALLPRALRTIVPSFPQPLLVGPFGAMAVLVFSAYKAPLAQPKNAVLGNAVGAAVGVAVFNLFALFGQESSPELLWFRAAIAVPLTIVVQEATGTVHPPGGAAALMLLIMKPMQQMGFLYVLTPSLFGAAVLVFVGMAMNNLAKSRSYPQGWW